MWLAEPATHRARSYAGPAGLREGRGAGRGRRGAGGGAAGCSRAPPRLRALSRRPGVPVQLLPPMGEVEPGPAGPLEPPEPPEAPASRRPGGIRVLKVRQAGGRVGEGAKPGSERPPLPRAVTGAAGRPLPHVRQSAWLLRGPAAPLGAPRPPPRPQRLAPAEASAACVPSAAHLWPRATRLAGPRVGSGVHPAAAAVHRLVRDSGARLCLQGRTRGPGAGPSWPESRAGST